MGRYVAPEEIANTELILCSDLAPRSPVRNMSSTAAAPPPAAPSRHPGDAEQDGIGGHCEERLARRSNLDRTSAQRPRLLRSARNDAKKDRHCEERSDEAIS